VKQILITTIAAVLVVGCAKAPDISIHDAARDGNIEAVKQAIADGANVNAKNDLGEPGGGATPLHRAATYGHKEIAELLIANGADVNAKDVGGSTPLDWATHPDNPNASAETADLLRKHGGKTSEELKTEEK